MNAVFQTSRHPILSGLSGCYFDAKPLPQELLFLNVSAFLTVLRNIRLAFVQTLPITGALLFLLLLSQQANASTPRGEIHWTSLNLTQQQESSINRLESQWQETHSEVTSQIERDREELQSLLPTGDSQRIRAVQNRMMTNKMYLMNESMNTFLQKRDVLTPEQRAQLQRMLPTAMQNLNGVSRYSRTRH